MATAARLESPLKMDRQIVCKICFNSSSHKPKPFLTNESSAIVDPVTKRRKKCPRCHQDWISITVHKEPGTSKWVHVRNNLRLQKNMVLCRVIKSGAKLCPKGQSCSFAHNQAEIAMYSTSRAVTNCDSLSQQSASRVATPRKPPDLSFQVKEHRLCKYTQANRKCLLDEYCTFAHSIVELKQWNQILKPKSYDAGSRETLSVPYNLICASDIPEAAVDNSSNLENNMDFALKVRSALVSMYRHNMRDLGMMETYDNVTIKEISNSKLSQRGVVEQPYEWTFEISATTTQTLKSVVLFDALSQDFQISSIMLITTSDNKQINLMKGKDVLHSMVDQKVEPTERVHVKITLLSHPGILCQLVLFEFQSVFRYFIMVRGLKVNVLSELEKRLTLLPSHKMKNCQEIDLLWERHYKEIQMETDKFSEVTDVHLDNYSIPENIAKSPTDETGFEGCLSKENYRERMHHLLFLEELECKKIMSRYDLYDVSIKPEKMFEEQLRSGTTYAQEGHYYVTLSLEESLFEGTNSIRSGDSAYIVIKSRREVHHCSVEHVGRETIVLLISESTKQACSENDNCCSIRFVLSRIQLRAMHHAIDHVDLDKIFPSVDSTASSISNPAAIKKCLKKLKKVKLNPHQNEVISSIINPEYIMIPTLILGPFGVGKTRTLCECIKLIIRNFPDSHILVCTHSNSAANLYVTDIHSAFEKNQLENESQHLMLRLYYTKRHISTIQPPLVLKYCKMKENQLVIPSLKEIMDTRIVVTTLVTSRILSTQHETMRGHFSHIIIDEAAQVNEPQTIIPICLAGPETKIVLAGDHLQLMPHLYSPIAKKNNFHITLLERLYDLKLYNSSNDSVAQCRNLLTINYRSCQEILELPSRLFYKTELVSCVTFPPKGPNSHSVRFVGINGQEFRHQGSPSYYNDQEAEEVCNQVEYLAKHGLKHQEICALAYDQMQVYRLRDFLRKANLSLVRVHRVHDVQGVEFRALIVSTVRTCTKEPPPEDDTGFLTDPKLFNTAITRAREWLIVIGEPVTLCTVGSNRVCWMEFIKYCCQHGSFDYPLAGYTSFETSLENKLILRSLLEERLETPLKDKLKGDVQIPTVKGRDSTTTQLVSPSLSSSEESRNISLTKGSERDDKNTHSRTLSLQEAQNTEQSLHVVNSTKKMSLPVQPQESESDVCHQIHGRQSSSDKKLDRESPPLLWPIACESRAHTWGTKVPTTGTVHTTISTSADQTEPIIVNNTKRIQRPKERQSGQVLHTNEDKDHSVQVKVDSNLHLRREPDEPDIYPFPTPKPAHTTVESDSHHLRQSLEAVNPALSSRVHTVGPVQAQGTGYTVNQLPLLSHPAQNNYSYWSGPAVESSHLNVPLPTGWPRIQPQTATGTHYFNVDYSMSGTPVGVIPGQTYPPHMASSTITGVQRHIPSQSKSYTQYPSIGYSRSVSNTQHLMPQPAVMPLLAPQPGVHYNNSTPFSRQSSFPFASKQDGVIPGQTYIPHMASSTITGVQRHIPSQPKSHTQYPFIGYSRSVSNIQHEMQQPVVMPSHYPQPGVDYNKSTPLSRQSSFPVASKQDDTEPINPSSYTTGNIAVKKPGQNRLDNEESSAIKIIEDVQVKMNRMIGNGAFGTVFEGIFNGNPCAVKVLHATATELWTDLPTGGSVQSIALDKFKLECDHLEKINHKNIVSHLATRTSKSEHLHTPVLVMELLDCSLRNYLSDKPTIKLFVQVSLSADVASALEFLHHRKMVHRDLCGDNILLSTNGPYPWPVAKVSDFGMSRIINLETLSRSLSAMGHRNGYLPPEAYLEPPNDSYDSSLDIFMFGAVMTQITTKNPYIKSEKMRKSLLASIDSSHPLHHFINKCLEKNKHARPTATDMREELSVTLEDCTK